VVGAIFVGLISMRVVKFADLLQEVDHRRRNIALLSEPKCAISGPDTFSGSSKRFASFFLKIWIAGYLGP
jgi:hypothetical protein